MTDNLLKKEMSPPGTPSRPKPSFTEGTSPKWAGMDDYSHSLVTDVATKVASDVAGQVSSLLKEQQLKLSPLVPHHIDCKPDPKLSSPCLEASNSSPGLPCSNSNTSEGLRYYLGRGPPSMASMVHCQETVPAAVPGTHVHHVYVDDSACAREEPKLDPRFVYLDGLTLGPRRRRGVSPISLGCSSGEEEITVRERRETRVSVGKKKARTEGNSNKR